MKGIFWNSRGLSDLAKASFISDSVKEQNLEFVALLETGKKEYTQSTLNSFCAGRNFIWHWTQPHGRSGGILLGVNLDAIDIGSIEEGDFFIKFKLRDRKEDFKWILVAVYGAAQPEYKESFLTELVRTCSKENLPMVIGGDFNIIRSPSEKNNDKYDGKWPFLFNAIIDSLDLREVEMSGRKYTWANSLENPTFEKLDRVLVSTEWEQKYPLATVQALTREISDHTPLLFNTGNKSLNGAQPLFKFELSWLLSENFMDIVSDLWNNTKKGTNAIQTWQNKVRRLRQFLRGWNKDKKGKFKKEKQELLRKAMSWILKLKHVL
jgi:exonuclease III